MKRNIGLFFVVLAFVSMFIAGCSKNSSNPEAPQSNAAVAPDVPQVSFTGPSNTSNDPVIGTISGYIQSLNVLKGYGDQFAGIQAVLNGKEWVRTFLNGSVTLTLTATLYNDTSYYWKLTVSGSKDTVKYDNWLNADGYTSLDGKRGTWNIYRQNSKVVDGTFSWNKASDGTITGLVTAYTNGNMTGKITLVNHPDKSGQVEVFGVTNLIFKAIWQSNGSGQWWTYGSNGNILHSGLWT